MNAFPTPSPTLAAPPWMALTAACWLALGAFLLAATPLPAHTDRLGWSPLFWLLLAPASLLLGLRARRVAGAHRPMR